MIRIRSFHVTISAQLAVNVNYSEKSGSCKARRQEDVDSTTTLEPVKGIHEAGCISISDNKKGSWVSTCLKNVHPR